MESPSSISIDSTWLRVQPWLVVFFASAFFFFEFMQVNMFNALDPYLFKAYKLQDSTQLGHLAACYMYANVIFLFPAGIILDRVSTRRLIMIAMFICVSCTLLFAFTTQLWQGEICRFITGIGGAFCLLSCVRLASRWFPPKKMALVVGLIVTFAMTGAMVAQTPFTVLALDYGWRDTMIVDALAGYMMLAFIALIVKDFPAGRQRVMEQQQHTLSKMGVMKTISKSFGSMQNWLAGIYASLINLPVFLLGSWGMMYLHQIHNMPREQASFITSAMFAGLIIGSPTFGWISDRMRRRRSPMIFGAVFSIATILPIMLWQHLSYETLLILFFLIGFAISSQIISYAVVAESNPEFLTGASEGVASVLIMSGGFLIPVFARLLDLSWHHHFVNGLPIYSLHSFRVAFAIMPISFVIALLASFAIKETYCKSYTEREEHA
jgi:MFS family permease